MPRLRRSDTSAPGLRRARRGREKHDHVLEFAARKMGDGPPWERPA
ncbi:MAG TPA: hypothetical protein VF204_21370 [Streptosporangiaceae bacterium]